MKQIYLFDKSRSQSTVLLLEHTVALCLVQIDSRCTGTRTSDFSACSSLVVVMSQERDGPTHRDYLGCARG
ncbi:hypothetical protein V6Z77_007852 [Aspergillus fumigatus]